MDLIRPNTLAINSKVADIKKRYSQTEDPLSFLKGCQNVFYNRWLRSGGTTTGDMALIGAEIVTGKPKPMFQSFRINVRGVIKEKSTEFNQPEHP